jgi:hypothetical protein
MPSFSRAFACLLALFLLTSSFVPTARADMRVFERGGEEGKAREHRYLDITGFLQPGWIFRLADENAGANDSGPWLQRARVGLTAQPVWWLRARMEIEFAPVPTLQDAYLEFRPHAAFTLRAGQFLVPFLRAYQFNELNLGFLDRPTYTPISPDRSFLRYLNPRDVGVMARGHIGDTSPGATSPVLEYNLGLFIGRGPNAARNDDDAFLYALRLQLHALGVPEGVHAESDLARNERPKLGIAAAVYSNCDDRANWNRGFDADAELRWKGLYASASFVWFRNGPASNDQFNYGDFCVGTVGPDGNPLEFISAGAHAQVQYVLPKALFPVKNQELELLVRGDWVDPNSPYDPTRPIRGGDENHAGYVPPTRVNDSDNAPTRFRMTFGLNWFPTGNQELRFQINYQHIRELEDMVTSQGVLVGVKNDILWLQFTAGL